MIEKINKIVNLMEEIKKENEVVGIILLTNFQNSMDIIKSLADNQPFDISKKIELLSNLLNINLEEIIFQVIEKNNTKVLDQNTKITDFILYDSTSKVDEYEKFLESNK